MKTYIAETEKATKELNAVLDQYLAEKSKVNKDLKPEIVNKKKAEIESRFFKSMRDAFDEVNTYLGYMETSAKLLADPINGILVRVAGPTVEPATSDLYFTEQIKKLDDEQVLFLMEEQARNSAVVLAGALELKFRNYKDSENRVYKLVKSFAPISSLQQMLNVAESAFKAILRYYDLKNVASERKLSLGHWIDEFRHTVEMAMSDNPLKAGTVKTARPNWSNHREPVDA